MRGSVRRALVLLAIFLAVASAVLLVNQTVQLVELAARMHPGAGDATLWGPIFLYAGCLAVPIIMLIRLPAPFHPPASGGPCSPGQLRHFGNRERLHDPPGSLHRPGLLQRARGGGEEQTRATSGIPGSRCTRFHRDQRD